MSTGESARTVRLVFPVLLAALIGIFYISSLDNPFLLNDFTAIVNNPDVTVPQGVLGPWLHQLTPEGHGGAMGYQPVPVLSYYLNARVTGMVPLAFRVVNIGLLALLAYLLFVWLQMYTKHPAAACLAAFLFAAHPAHAESINHVVGRADLLAMIGVVGFAALQRWAYLLVQKIKPREGRNMVTLAAVTVNLFIAAMVAACVAVFSASGGGTLVAVALAQAWVAYPKRKDRPASWFNHLAVDLVVIACLGVVLWSYWWARGIAAADASVSPWAPQLLGPYDLPVNPLRGLSRWERLPAVFSIVTAYTQLLLSPNLNFNHAPLQAPGWSDVTSWVGILIMSFYLLGAVVCGYRRHWLCVAFALVLSQCALVGNFWHVTDVYVSNLRIFPLTLAAAMGVAWLIDRTAHDSTRRRVVAALPIAGLIAAMFAVVLNVNAQWFSSARLMASEYARRPDDPASVYYYGSALLHAGQYEEAETKLELAIAYQFAPERARHKLATARLLMGDSSGAEFLYRRILDGHPADLRAHTQLANIALARQEYDETRYHYEEAQRVSPLDADVLHLGARLARADGDTDTAGRLYRVLIRRYPEHTTGRMESLQLEEEGPPVSLRP